MASCCLTQGAGLGGHLEGKKAAGRLRREGLYGYTELIHVVTQQKKSLAQKFISLSGFYIFSKYVSWRITSASLVMALTGTRGYWGTVLQESYPYGILSSFSFPLFLFLLKNFSSVSRPLCQRAADSCWFRNESSVGLCWTTLFFFLEHPENGNCQIAFTLNSA